MFLVSALVQLWLSVISPFKRLLNGFEHVALHCLQLLGLRNKSLACQMVPICKNTGGCGGRNMNNIMVGTVSVEVCGVFFLLTYSTNSTPSWVNTSLMVGQSELLLH